MKPELSPVTTATSASCQHRHHAAMVSASVLLSNNPCSVSGRFCAFVGSTRQPRAA
jgi:hypothetical protein